MTVLVSDGVRPVPARDVLDVTVVSPAAMVRAGFGRMLADMPGLSVRRALDSLALLPPSSPGLAVVDVCGLGRNRLTERIWTMLPAGTRVVLVCRPSDLPPLPAAVRAGVRAFVIRNCNEHELCAAVDSAGRDGLYVSADLVEALSDPAGDGRTDRRTRLGDRGVETLRLVAEGFTHREIGRRLGPTEATINTCVKRIRAKLSAANKAELTGRAIEPGYVTPR
jgi:DNA-binding NarL/FixJ family response regulator